MRNILKKFLPCLLLVITIFAMSSCKSKDKYKYPSVVPNLTDSFANQTFAKVGNLTVTNGDVYYRLLNSYGLETLERLLDEKLLTFTLTEDQEKDFQDSMTELIYNTKDVASLTLEEKADLEKDFKLSMLSDGLIVDESKKDNSLYYENYYRLEYKRKVKTIEVLKQEIADYNTKADETAKEDGTDPVYYFTSDKYLSYFTSNFHKKYDLIIVTFDSEKQAKETMKAANIDTTSLNGPWKNTTGSEMTKDDLIEAFKAMYKTTYNEDCSGSKTYSYNDLVKIATSSSQDKTIATKAITLNANDLNKSYTHGPLAFNGRWYVMLATGESDAYYNDNDETISYKDDSENITTKDDSNNVTEITKALEESLFDDVLLASISTSTDTYNYNIERVMFELRQKAGLEIFAEGLETIYKNEFNTAYSKLSKKEYDAFKETKNTSSTVVAKIDNYEITTDTMFNALSDRYSALIMLLFIQQYAILGSEYNKVVNYETGEILDQEKYNSYLKTDVTDYKEAFNKGNFAANGYPASYGWENFLRDYVGLTDEKDAVVDFNGTLYNDVLALYTKAIYTASVDDVELVVLTDSEGAKTWGLKSAKWVNVHDTKVTVVDESKKPQILLVYTENDFNKANADLTKMDFYGHFVLRYTDAEGKTVDALTPVTADQAVMEKYDDIFEETFSATVSGVYAYYDKDLDGVADEIDDSSAEAEKATELVNKVWNKAKTMDKDNTIYTNISSILREYATSSITSEWMEYKQAGLRLKAIQSSSYSNTSSADKNILSTVKAMWDDIVDYKNLTDPTNPETVIGTTITGQSLDPGYRYQKSNKVYYVTAYDFSEKYNAVYAENCIYKLAITKATAKTSKYYYTTSGGVEKNQQYVSLYLYEQYLLDSKDREVTVNVSSQITNYYTKAISALASDSIVNTNLMEGCKEALSKTSFTTNNDYFKSVLTEIINAAIEGNK